MSRNQHRFSVTLAAEVAKLRRSLALLLALAAPLLVAVFVFSNVLRVERALTWDVVLMSSAAVWAYFMLPMSVTALTALLAHTEHGPRTWDHLRALPLPRWHLYGAKAVAVLAVVAAMSALLAIATLVAAEAAAWLKPANAPSGSRDIHDYMLLLTRIFVAGWLLTAVQLWVALRFASFVPALATGIGGTFFAVVASSASVGVVLPWHIPINQLASDPGRADLALAIGGVGGCLAFAAMLWHLSHREVL